MDKDSRNNFMRKNHTDFVEAGIFMLPIEYINDKLINDKILDNKFNKTKFATTAFLIILISSITIVLGYNLIDGDKFKSDFDCGINNINNTCEKTICNCNKECPTSICEVDCNYPDNININLTEVQ